MKKVYITFSGAQYHAWTERIVRDAPHMGADSVIVYDDQWLLKCRPAFVEQNMWLWQQPTRGFGWFAWKPLIILDALSRVNNGDVVFYTDADTYPIKDFSIVFEIAQRDGIMLFSAAGLKHRQWCKRDCFIVMGQDTPEYNSMDVQAGVARFMAFQKGHYRNTQFLYEWLTYCVNPLATTFQPSVLAPEYPELREHRTEQAIMTCLAHKYKHKLWREACAFGNAHSEDKDHYTQLFEQNGSHSYGPTNSQGSYFRNVQD